VEVQQGMETFFSPFSVHIRYGATGLLYDYQRIFRFGATLLVVSTLLILAGLFVGPRRNRIAVLALGAGSLAMLVLPVFGSNYNGRYMVPFTGVLAAAAAVAFISLVSRLRQRFR